MLYTNGVVHMLDMRCCVHMVLCTWWICSVVYIWHGVHVVYMMLCTCGVVYIWHCVHVTHVVILTCGLCICFTSGVVYALCNCVMYMLCRWCCVHVVNVILLYMWYCVYVIHAFLCMFGTVYVHCVVVVS